MPAHDNSKSRLDSRAEFPETEWSLILAQPSDPDLWKDEALDRLARAYLSPVYAYLQVRLRLSREDAEDVASAFLARIAEHALKARSAEGGRRPRLRDFLRACAYNLACNELDKKLARKRGGNIHHESFEVAAETLDKAGGADRGLAEAEIAFDREWAAAVVAEARMRLGQEYERAGKKVEFKLLIPWLVRTPEELKSNELAHALGVGKETFRQRLRRFRVAFGTQLRVAVRGTLADPADLPEELRHLMEVCRATGEFDAPTDEGTKDVGLPRTG